MRYFEGKKENQGRNQLSNLRRLWTHFTSWFCAGIRNSRISNFRPSLMGISREKRTRNHLKIDYSVSSLTWNIWVKKENIAKFLIVYFGTIVGMLMCKQEPEFLRNYPKASTDKQEIVKNFSIKLQDPNVNHIVLKLWKKYFLPYEYLHTCTVHTTTKRQNTKRKTTQSHISYFKYIIKFFHIFLFRQLQFSHKFFIGKSLDFIFALIWDHKRINVGRCCCRR